MLGVVMKSVYTKLPARRLAVILSIVASRKYSSQTSMSKSKKSPNRVFRNLPSNVVILGVDKENPIDVRSLPAIPEDCEVVRAVKDCPKHLSPARIWLDSFESMDFTPTKAVELHPDVFATNPRIDFLHLCKEWQMNYREVDYTWMPTRAEVGRGRKKPWPQKGLGKARHGSTNAPQWKGGGIAHGPRGPKALYQKILPNVRLRALISALSIKYFQEDICVVQDFDITSTQQEELREILSNRGINHSALLVHSDSDNIAENSDIATALEHWAEFNLMPLVGLNMWSLLHHEKLVLTLQALEELETKILWNLNRYDWIGKPHNFYRDLPFTVKNETSVDTDTPVSTNEE